MAFSCLIALLFLYPLWALAGQTHLRCRGDNRLEIPVSETFPMCSSFLIYRSNESDEHPRSAINLIRAEISEEFQNKIFMSNATGQWIVSIQCPFQGELYCKLNTSLSCWIVRFDKQQEAWLDQQQNAHLNEIQRMKKENDEMRRNLTNPEQTLTEEEPTNEHNPESKDDGTGRERDTYNHVESYHAGSVIAGYIFGLVTAIAIAWERGSNIQRFLKPFWYHMNLHSVEKERKTTDQITYFTPAYNYMECKGMKTVELSCKAESILDVAIFENDILSVSGRGSYIDKSSIPYANINGSFMLNGLMSCFCCKSNTLGDHAANVPEDIKYPWSMAVDSLNKCVYVSGYQNEFICRIPLIPGTDTATAAKWSVFGGQKPAAVQVSLSMENNGNIIAVSLEVNWLEEYNSDGELVRKIELKNSDDYAHIQHAVKKADGYYVLVHGWKEDKYHRACLVDAEGILKSYYGHSKGDAIGDRGQLNTPTHLAVDKNNFVLVTDYNNHRIILLDPDLKFVKVLITPDACLYRPCRLILDERDEDGRGEAVRLCVGEDRKEPRARIMVFFLKRRGAFKDPESEPLKGVEYVTTE